MDKGVSFAIRRESVQTEEAENGFRTEHRRRGDIAKVRQVKLTLVNALQVLMSDSYRSVLAENNRSVIDALSRRSGHPTDHIRTPDK